MPREFSRTLRVADQIQRELSELIRNDIKDPRLGPVTITQVEIVKDLSYAKVWVGFLGDLSRCDEALAILNKASGFLHRELKKRMQMRVIPVLKFFYDDILDSGPQMEQLIKKAVAQDRQRQDENEPNQSKSKEP